MNRNMPKIPIYKTGFMLDDGQKIYFDEGGFDKWCVYVKEKGVRKPNIPTDVDYFTRLVNLGEIYGYGNVYDSFCKVYDGVSESWDREDKIRCYTVSKEVDSNYDENTLDLWIILFMTMLAEQMKKDAILKKRIKKFAVYLILMKRKDIESVAYGLEGMGWKKIRNMMVSCGIIDKTDELWYL